MRWNGHAHKNFCQIREGPLHPAAVDPIVLVPSGRIVEVGFRCGLLTGESRSSNQDRLVNVSQKNLPGEKRKIYLELENQC